MKNKLSEPANFNNWVLLYSNLNAAEDFYDTLNQSSKCYGVRFEEPYWVWVESSNDAS